jgi:opacity protein-like surface antigen
MINRKLMVCAALAAACAVPATARAQGSGEITGFGGLTVGTSTFGSAVSSTFGGRVAANLTPNLQVLGEAGRLTDIRSPLFDVLDYTNLGLRVSAFYGEGGVRFLGGSPHSNFRPYGEATAGFAKLSAGVSGLPGGIADGIVDTALAFVNTTRPVLGVGTGIVIQGGPVSVDVGYRYKKISTNAIVSALNAGQDFQINQVRVGIGFRF